MCVCWLPFGKKGWNLYDLDTKEIFASRDIFFVKDTFPLSGEFSATGTETCAIDLELFDVVDYELPSGEETVTPLVVPETVMEVAPVTEQHVVLPTVTVTNAKLAPVIDGETVPEIAADLVPPIGAALGKL